MTLKKKIYVKDIQCEDTLKNDLEKYSSETRSKVVVRFIPPNYDVESFKQHIGVEIFNDISNYYLVQGKVRKSTNEIEFGRAYLKFNGLSKAEHFIKLFNGQIFKDKTGNSSKIIVDMAPYQRLVLNKTKDSLVNTYKEDPEYENMLKALKLSNK